MFACVRVEFLTGYLQNTSKKRHSALTNTRGHVSKQTPHKSRITSYIHNRGEETQTNDAGDSSISRKKKQASVRPAIADASRKHNKRVCQIPLARLLFRTPRLHNILSIVRFEMLHHRRFRRCSNTSRNTEYLRRNSSNTRCVLLSVP